MDADEPVYYCGRMTFAGRMQLDPEPPEWCENLVENEGDVCSVHAEGDDEDARAEAAREQAWEDARWD